MKRFLTPILAFALGSTLSVCVEAQQQTDRPDNTGINARDHGKNTPTADQQRDDQSDVKLTQEIRRSITQDKSLSTYAHNVKIVTQNGMVTLRGPVRSEHEKSAVESKAAAVAGAKHVKNELQVAPDKNQQQTH